MILSIESAYGNFELVVRIELEVAGDVRGQVLGLAKLGLASEIYRVGNSAVDKAFAPKREGKNGKLVAQLAAWKGEDGTEHPAFKRETVAFSKENAEVLKAALTAALEKSEYKVDEVITKEKVRGEEAAPMKRAREMVEKAALNKTLAALAMLIGYDGEDGEDQEVLIPLVHAWMNPKK